MPTVPNAPAPSKRRRRQDGDGGGGARRSNPPRTENRRPGNVPSNARGSAANRPEFRVGCDGEYDASDELFGTLSPPSSSPSAAAGGRTAAAAAGQPENVPSSARKEEEREGSDGERNWETVDENGGGCHPGTSIPLGMSLYFRNGYGELVENGWTFTDVDIADLTVAIDEYCASAQITRARLCTERTFMTELHGCWTEIAKSLPHRTVQSVYRRGIRQHHTFDRGEWLQAEVARLRELVLLHGRQWATIGGMINRTGEACRDTYSKIKHYKRVGRWETHEVEMLLDHVRDLVKAPKPDMDVIEINRHCLDNDITLLWSIISTKMGNRIPQQVYNKWLGMTGRANKRAVSRGEEVVPMPRERSRDADPGIKRRYLARVRDENGPYAMGSAWSASVVGTYKKSVTTTSDKDRECAASGIKRTRAVSVKTTSDKDRESTTSGIKRTRTASLPTKSEKDRESATSAAQLRESDLDLIRELVRSRPVRPIDVCWSSLLSSGGVGLLDRWNFLVDEYLEGDVTGRAEEDLDLPLWKLAARVGEATAKKRRADTIERKLAEEKDAPVSTEGDGENEKGGSGDNTSKARGSATNAIFVDEWRRKKKERKKEKKEKQKSEKNNLKGRKRRN